MYEQAHALPDAACETTSELTPADDRERLATALALAKLHKLRAKYVEELLPALKDAARAYLVFALHAAKARTIYDEFNTAGIQVPAPASLMIPPETLRGLVQSCLDAKFIDSNDVLLADLPAQFKPE